jgi:hypothetical protein
LANPLAKDIFNPESWANYGSRNAANDTVDNSSYDLPVPDRNRPDRCCTQGDETPLVLTAGD